MALLSFYWDWVLKPELGQDVRFLLVAITTSEIHMCASSNKHLPVGWKNNGSKRKQSTTSFDGADILSMNKQETKCDVLFIGQ